MRGEAWVSLRGVSFGWPNAATKVLEGVELELGRGFYGLVGENGAGKSTLLSVLAGELEVEGRVESSGPVVRVPQESERPTAEVVLFGEDEGADALALRRVLNLSVSMLGRWETLSAGERKRWLVGAAVWAGPEILLLDEPESHLDVRGREALVGALRRHRGLGILVAHDRDLLDEVTSRTLVVERGKVRLLEGSISTALAQLEAERRALVERRASLKDKVEARAAQRDQARAVARSASAARTSDRMKGIRDHDGRSMGAKNLANWAAAGHAKKARLAEDAWREANAELESVRVERELGGEVAFELAPSGRAFVASVEGEVEVGGRVLLDGLSLFVRRDDRIHVSGDNGVGKSTLLRRLGESADPLRHLVLPQELSADRVAGLRGEVDALCRESRGRCYQLVGALGAPPERVMASGRLSPGEAKKLALAVGLARGVELLILDEPENHLDLPSVERLVKALERWPGALVLVTHDAALARRVTATTWRVAKGKVTVGQGG